MAKHADAKGPIESWHQEVQNAEWKSPDEIKKRYGSASFLKGNAVIFNIKGNKYRLVVKVAYNSQTILIVWAGTHAEYDKEKF